MSLNHGAFQPGSAGSVVSKENFKCNEHILFIHNSRWYTGILIPSLTTEFVLYSLYNYTILYCGGKLEFIQIYDIV